MAERRVDAFFYGLFMDLDVLREGGGAAPIDPRRASVDGFALRIGQRARDRPVVRRASPDGRLTS